jgi:hypothetical protein
MFEKATRLKLRFPYRGNCTVEDLWDLPVHVLDDIFKELNATAKISKEESLLNEKTKEDEILDLGISIIRHIVEVKLKEIAEKESAKERADKKQKLLAILDKKQGMELEGKSAEEIQKMIAELD